MKKPTTSPRRRRHQRSSCRLWAPILASLLAPLLVPTVGRSGAARSELSADEGYELVRGLMSATRRDRVQAAEKLQQADARPFVPVITDALFFIPATARREALTTLMRLTGSEAGSRYYDWVEYVGGAEIEPPPGYLEWKVSLLERIDTRYRHVLYPDAPMRIRLDEVVWGGVRLDGIPALDTPAQVPAAEAGFMRDRERVFGVAIAGDVRAYPVKVLSWHEMLNDEIGGEPVTLSYCTLCGSGILFSTRTEDGGALTFGTSGLLYRSNKLMFDRQTLSLWSNLTGEAVVGRHAGAEARLTMLPATLTTWKSWRTLHPQTTVMKPDYALARRIGYRYDEGAADRYRAGVSFPVWQQSEQLARHEEVWAMRLDGKAKAWPMAVATAERVINDRLGETPLVLVGREESGAVRAYARRDRTFAIGEGADELIDHDGMVWLIEEHALVPAEGRVAEELPRLPGHVAFWFGWYGFYPETEVYGAEPADDSSGNAD